MHSAFHGRVFYHLPARQLLSMGALSPRRRRVVQICRQFIVCWPQRSSTGSFCGLRYNPIRIQRLFLPTFSGKTDGTKLQTSEAFAIWRGRATERMRPAACGGARDVEFVRTRVCEATVAVLPRKRQFGEFGQVGRQSRRPLQGAMQNRLRSNDCGVTASTAVPVTTGKPLAKLRAVR